MLAILYILTSGITVSFVIVKVLYMLEGGYKKRTIEQTVLLKSTVIGSYFTAYVLC